MTHGTARRIALWLPFASFLGCGPDAINSTKGEQCLVPGSGGEDIAIANEDVLCVEGEDLEVFLNLDVSKSPELLLRENDCFLLAQEVEVEVPCTVVAISNDEDYIEVGLECTSGDEQIYPLALQIGSPALHFEVCESDVLYLNYRKTIPNCWETSIKFALRDGSGRIVAASILGAPEPWISPLKISFLSDAGCSINKFLCTTSTRTAVRVGDDVFDGAIVYDGTRRVVQLSSRYIVQAIANQVEILDSECDDYSTYRLDLVLAEP